MDLSILRLGSPRQRYAAASFSFDPDTGYSITVGSPVPRTQLGSLFLQESEMAFEQQVAAAIPFTWESKPGTPRNGSLTGGDSEDEDEEEESKHGSSDSKTSSRNSSPRGTDDSSNNSQHSDFEFSKRFDSTDTPSVLSPRGTLAHADELFYKGHMLPLKPPPAIHSSIRQLMAVECGDNASPGSFNSGYNRSPGRSFRRDGLKALCPTPKRDKTPTPLGFEEFPKSEKHQKSRSFFRRKSAKDSGCTSDSEAEMSSGELKEDTRPLSSISSRTLVEYEAYKKKYAHEEDQSREFDFSEDFCDTHAEVDVNVDSSETAASSIKPKHPSLAFLRLPRFFSRNKQPSRLSAVAPAPSLKSEVNKSRSAADQQEQSEGKRGPSPLLRMVLSNCVCRAFTKSFREQPHEENHFMSATHLMDHPAETDGNRM